MEIILLLLTTLLLSSCAPAPREAVDGEIKTDRASEAVETSKQESVEAEIEIAAEPEFELELDYDTQKAAIVETFSDITPTSWGENVAGVLTEIDTDEKIVALTFDACIGTPNAYDAELINFLIAEEIPATLFIGGHWLEAYEAEFAKLAANPLFEIANHGYDHKPLSVTGESVYGIAGTQNVAEVFDEIYYNQQLIEERTGEKPAYFRAGTAYYDEVAVAIASELGLKTVNFNKLGDAGGTFNANQITASLEAAEPGSIYLFHMNQPDSDIANGIQAGISQLKHSGYRFVQLGEVDDLLK